MPTLEMLDIAAPRSILRDVRVLDITQGTLTDVTDVTVSNGRIEAVGRAAGDNGAVNVQGEGLTLLPGLIDCHAHILSPFLTKQEGYLAIWPIRQMHRNLRTNLAAGVVMVRDMLSPIRVMNSVRLKLKRGKLHGPDILASGAILSCPGGYPEFIHPLRWPLSAIVGTPKYELTSTAAAEKAVHYLKHCGANHIKVGYTSRPREYVGPLMPVVSREILDIICKTAHDIGLKVSVHHNWSDDIVPILQCDIDSLEHQCNDRCISDAEVELVLSKGVTVIPTLSISHDMAYFDKKTRFMQSQAAVELFEPFALNHLRFVSNTWLDRNERSYHDVFGYWRANPEAYNNSKKTAAKLAAAGVPVLAGTDFGAVCTFSGELSDEIRRFTLIGFSNIDAIRAATSRAAAFMGVERDLGSIDPGKKANFFVIEGNPLEDITTLRNVRLIAKDNNWYRPGGDTTTPLFNDDYVFI